MSAWQLPKVLVMFLQRHLGILSEELNSQTESGNLIHSALKTLATYTYCGQEPLPFILEMVASYKELAWSTTKGAKADPHSSEMVE